MTLDEEVEYKEKFCSHGSHYTTGKFYEVRDKTGKVIRKICESCKNQRDSRKNRNTSGEIRPCL